MKTTSTYMDAPLNGMILTDSLDVGETPAVLYPAFEVGSL